LAQRKKGRPGAMLGVDLSLTKKEEAVVRKREHHLKWKNKQHNENAKFNQVVVLESSSPSSTDSSDSDVDKTVSNIERAVGGVTSLAKKRGRKVILTPSVLSALERTKVSARRAVEIIAPLINASGQCINEFSLNRSSVRRHRSKCAAALKDNLKFNPQKPLVLHWDGKLMKDLTGDEKVDRLLILVSGSGID